MVGFEYRKHSLRLQLKEEALQLGAYCFMEKPSSIKELTEKLKLLFISRRKGLNA
jgi:hypothetical protein